MKEGKEKKALLVLFVCIVLLVVVEFTWVANMATPKKVFEISIDKIMDCFNKTKDWRTVSGDLSLAANFTSSNENKSYDMFNQFAIANHYEMDMEKNIVNLSFASTYREKDFVDADFYIKEDYAYLSLGSLFDHYLEIPIEHDTFDSKDFEIVLNEIQEAIHSALKKEYFESEKATLSLNDKNVHVTKNKFNLTVENQKTFYKDILHSLNNDAFLQSAAAITQKDIEEVRSILEEMLKEEMDIQDDVVITIYTSGMRKNFVGFEIKDSSTSLQVFKEKKNYFTYSLDDEDKINGSVEIAGDEKDFVLTFTMAFDEEQMTFILKNSMQYDIPIEDVEVSDAIPYSTLTKEEQNTIISRLQQKEGILEFLKDLADLFNEPSPTIIYD